MIKISYVQIKESINKFGKTKHGEYRRRHSTNSTRSPCIRWSKHQVCYYVFFFYQQKFASVFQNSNLLFIQSSSDECFIKPCSSKATSVIRLACQKSPKPSTSSSPLSSLIAPSQTKGENIRPTNRQSVKKLVLKLKKPFVPVIEEEANLHPPGKYNSFQIAFITVIQHYFYRWNVDVEIVEPFN